MNILPDTPREVCLTPSERYRAEAAEGIRLARKIEEFCASPLVKQTAARLGMLDKIRHEALTDPVTESSAAWKLQMRLVFDGAEGEDDEFAAQCHWAARWARTGLNVYNVSPSLAAALLLTKPPTASEETKVLPYPTFQVLVPSSAIPFWEDEEQKWVDRIVVHRYRMLDGDYGYVIQATCQDMALFRRERFENLSKRTLEHIDTSLSEGTETTPHDEVTLDACVRLVQNLIVWVQTHTPTLQNPPRPQKKGRSTPHDRSGTPAVWILGREVSLSPELRKMSTERLLAGSKEEVPGWRLRWGHTVEGHWKQQVHGPGGSLRKIVHVESYWRGPKDAAAWSHVYTDKK